MSQNKAIYLNQAQSIIQIWSLKIQPILAKSYLCQYLLQKKQIYISIIIFLQTCSVLPSARVKFSLSVLHFLYFTNSINLAIIKTGQINFLGLNNKLKCLLPSFNHVFGQRQLLLQTFFVNFCSKIMNFWNDLLLC